MVSITVIESKLEQVAKGNQVERMKGNSGNIHTCAHLGRITTKLEGCRRHGRKKDPEYKEQRQTNGTYLSSYL